jgi:hypothetical protein
MPAAAGDSSKWASQSVNEYRISMCRTDFTLSLAETLLRQDRHSRCNALAFGMKNAAEARLELAHVVTFGACSRECLEWDFQLQ